jgi:hypothetical protein
MPFGVCFLATICLVSTPTLAAEDPVPARSADATNSAVSGGNPFIRDTGTIFRPRGTVADLASDPGPLPPGSGVGDRLDDWHDKLFVWTNRKIAATDRRFADPDLAPVAQPITPFILGFETTYIDHNRGGSEDHLLLNADMAVQMPNTERRLKLFITSDPLSEEPYDRAGRLRDLRLGARYSFLEHLDFDIGVRARIWPEAFTSVKWGTNLNAGDWRMYPFLKAFVTSKDGIGTAGGFSVDHWSREWLLRSSTWAQLLKKNDYPTWTQTFAIANVRELYDESRYGSRARVEDIARGCAIILSAQRDRRNFSGVALYDARLLYKHPVHGNWLYWYIEPGVQWDRDYRYNPDPVVTVGFDVLFWDRQRR